MGAHLVEPGAVLADRYVVEDLLAEEGDSDSWRARDKILARSVVLQILPSSSPYASEVLAAAKHASRVADPRILQILDAVEDGDLTYVVREWASGQSLDVVLSEGPLPARRATWLIREVAAAIGNAHRMGLSHRRLAPDTVVITKSSGVKVIGLGTFAALQHSAEASSEPERADTLDLGRLLYACLTARWPGDETTSLPAAPTEHGRLLRPRQVRAGVPRPLDAVCDRILGQPPRFGEPITAVAEVEDALTQILSDEGLLQSTGGLLAVPAAQSGYRPPAEPHPALITRQDETAPAGDDQPPHAAANGNGDSSNLGQTLMWTVIAVLAAGAMLLAYLVGQHAASQRDNSGANASGSSVGAGHPLLPINSVRDFDPPPGSGDENPELVGLAHDGKDSTAWETLRYDGDPALGGLKTGVGLIVDLGKVQAVRDVEVALQGDGTDLELRAAPESATTAPMASADDYRLVDSITGAGTEALFALTEPVRTRFLLVWLTSLPSEGGDTYRGRVAEIRVRG